MNKQMLFKWCKRIIIVLSFILSMLVLYIICRWIYWFLYTPWYCNYQYQKGIEDSLRVENIAKQLFNINDPLGKADTKALELITYYAQKGNYNAQIMLEQYNEKHEIAIESNISINKHIWGISLGKSTKQDVVQYLDSIGIGYQKINNDSIIQVYDSFVFAGVYWNHAYYCFTNDVVYKIIFELKSREHSKYFSELKSLLARKYTKSKKFESKYNDGRKFLLKDSNTQIELDNSHFKELIYKYIDTTLEKEKETQNFKDI